MSTTNWYVSTNGTTWTTCAAAGISRPRLTLRANGVDELAFSVDGDFLASAAFAYGNTIRLAYVVTTGGSTTYTTRFIGRINTIPRQASAQSESIQFTAQGGWWWLDQIVYLQQWQVMQVSDYTLHGLTLPRVVLGQDDTGARRTMGAEVASAIDWAIARGAPIAKGTIDTLATCPYSEHTNITVGDVIRQALRLQPDTICWFDYSSGTPTFHCRAASALSTVNIAVLATAIDTIAMTPRYDLQLPGITIYYEITSSVNGQSFKSVTSDSAGTTSDARSASVIFPLEGVQAQTAEQAISVTAYPIDTTDKTFWRSQLPWLADVADADLTIANVTRSGTKTLGNYLKDGQICSWMGVDSEQETWTAEISYVSKTSGAIDESVAVRKVSVKLLSCGGTTKTYRTTLSFTAAEPAPTGLAAALYASWSRLHWDGSFRLVEQEASFQCAPGCLVNLTGGLAAWASMAALVPEISVDLEAGSTTVTTGTYGRLQADTLMALWRGIQNRRFAASRLSRADAGASSAIVSGGANLPVQNSDEGDPGRPRRIVVRDTSAESFLQTIDLNPAAVVHAVSGDRTNRTLAPQEAYITVVNPSTGVRSLQKLQLMGTVPYGSAIPLCNSSIPSYDVLGAYGTGLEGVDSASWTVGSGKGVALNLDTRNRYYSAGLKQWFAYIRTIMWDQNGMLASISGEFRQLVETPELP